MKARPSAKKSARPAAKKPAPGKAPASVKKAGGKQAPASSKAPARSKAIAAKKPAGPAAKKPAPGKASASSKKAASAKPAAKPAITKGAVRPVQGSLAAKAPAGKPGKAVRPPAVAAKGKAVVRSGGPVIEEVVSEITAHGEPLTASETAALLDHVRAIVHRLPETTEVEAWGHPTFRVNNKIFVGYGVENGTASLGVKTTPDMQAALVSSDPRFTVAAYVGQHGWVSMSLAGAIDLGEVEALVRGSYRLVAPTKLVRQLDEAEG